MGSRPEAALTEDTPCTPEASWRHPSGLLSSPEVGGGTALPAEEQGSSEQGSRRGGTGDSSIDNDNIDLNVIPPSRGVISISVSDADQKTLRLRRSSSNDKAPLTSSPNGRPLTSSPNGRPLASSPNGRPLASSPNGRPLASSPKPSLALGARTKSRTENAEIAVDHTRPEHRPDSSPLSAQHRAYLGSLSMQHRADVGSLSMQHRQGTELSPQRSQDEVHLVLEGGEQGSPSVMFPLDLEEFEDVENQKLVANGSSRSGTKQQQRSGGCYPCWMILLFVGAALVALVAVGSAAAFLGPLVFEKIILPLMEWEEQHLSKPLLAFVAVSCMAFFPIAMLPTGPSMWLLGIAFDYFWGFCFIMIGAFFGQSFPYAFGHWIMHDRVQGWLSSNARLTAILRLADSGGWFQQFKTTLFLRMSPFPYPLFNYAITATKIKYGPYICASMVAMIPETFIAIYCGKLIQKLAMAHNDPLKRPITALEIAYEVVGLCVAGSVVMVGMYHGHKAFKELEMQEKAQREGQEMAMGAEGGLEGGGKEGKGGGDLLVKSKSSGSGKVMETPSEDEGSRGSSISLLGRVLSGYTQIGRIPPNSTVQAGRNLSTESNGGTEMRDLSEARTLSLGEGEATQRQLTGFSFTRDALVRKLAEFRDWSLQKSGVNKTEERASILG